ncbi:MAG: NEW3 domain-containing protein, partial [Dehalococcoidales bacterium]|nr:NEW3 domain-containing protein [Dehalococcoidales bacterium]
KNFDITNIDPEGWQTSITRQYGGKGEGIRAIQLNPNMSYPDRLKVTLSPLPNTEPGPGDYILTIGASSGDIEDTIELTAVVTEIPPTHELNLVTNTGRLDAIAKAGEDNTLTINLTNSGTGTIEDISFTSDKSQGWGITFSPTSIASLEPGESEDIEVTIIPPNRTIAGDYSVTLTATGSDSSYDRVLLRVSVHTPTTWGGAGIAIIAAVVTGLVFLFRKLGRR